MAIKAGVYRGVTAADRAADRRERLFEATLEVWGRDGGPSVTMTRICAEAGLTERYFYENFSGL
ncbi:MAG: TetR/AcrR family transcriptional regulator, partial [Aeromicrobium sp.]